MLGPFQIALHRLAAPSLSENLTAQTPREPFPVTFEAVFAALEAWPRMFIEPDGSFVWVGEAQNPDGSTQAWQLDGHLYDRADQLLFVELQGTCARAALDELVALLGVELETLCVEQRREGTIVRWNRFLTLST